MCIQPYAQKKFRSGIFLHHSTGGRIWGPNTFPNSSSKISIPTEITKYNSSMELKSSEQFQFKESWFLPEDNEWYIVRDFFEGKINGKNPEYNFKNENPADYYYNYDIIMIKSCYPSSKMVESSDGDDRKVKSLTNYKNHWRAIIRIMEQHPDNFFVIWTNAPLEARSTNTTEAMLSKEFCNWAKNILAQGKDPEYGAFPKNVYVFDFFSKLTAANGIMEDKYRDYPEDSHPNSYATELVAPILVKEVFDAALAYERTSTPVNNETADRITVFPNPAKERLNIKLSSAGQSSEVVISNLCGQVVIREQLKSLNTSIDIAMLPKGIYFVNLLNGDKKETVKVMIQ